MIVGPLLVVDDLAYTVLVIDDMRGRGSSNAFPLPDYGKANLPVVRRRLYQAGVRLATVLNEAFREE